MTSPENDESITEAGAEVGSNAVPDRPQKDPKMLELMAATWQSGPGAAVNPEVAKKVTSEHISTILENEDRQGDRVLKHREGGRKTKIILAVTGGVILLVLVGMLVFTGNAEMTDRVIRDLIAVTFGGFGRYGLGRVQGR